MFKNWPWQKWVSRGSKFLMAVVVAFFKLVAPEAEPDWVPTWWPIISPIILLVIDTIIGLFPVKTTTPS